VDTEEEEKKTMSPQWWVLYAVTWGFVLLPKREDWEDQLHKTFQMGLLMLMIFFVPMGE
jgi:hypothetical protein